MGHIKNLTLLCERMSDFCYNVHKVFWKENTGNSIIKVHLQSYFIKIDKKLL